MMREINLHTGTTFVLVTHDPDVAAACDRVIHMRDGRVADADAEVSHWAWCRRSPASLSSRPTLIRSKKRADLRGRSARAPAEGVQWTRSSAPSS